VTTLLHTEWLKLRATRLPWLLLIIPLFVVAYGAANVITSSGRDAQHSENMAAAGAHVGLVSVFPLVLGIIAMTSEYRHRTIADTYLSTPRRSHALLAKLGFYAAVGAGFAIVAAVVDLVTITVTLNARGYSFHIWNSSLWLTLLGSFLWCAMFGAIGVAAGALIRNVYIAIIGTLVFLYLIEGAIAQTATGFSHWLPFAAGQSLAHQPETDGLPPWVAGLLLAAYTVALCALTVVICSRRDLASGARRNMA